MSSTNKTTYYNLSQFANTDKPSWLNDYNNDMTIIDTNIKNNANNISTNSANINTNSANIGTLSNLTTTAKDSLVSAINEVASSSGGGGVQILDVTNNSSQNPLIFDDLSVGEYILYVNNSSTYLTTKQLRVKNKSSDSDTELITIVSGATLKVIKKLEDMTNRYDYMGEVSYIYVSSYGKRKIYIANIGKTSTNKIEVNVNANNYLITASEPTANKMIRTDNQGGVYWGDFNSIGANYDSTKTQYLKNVSGTMSWVEETSSTPTMIYLGKINDYSTSGTALNLSNYLANTRIVLKNNDSTRSFYIKVGSNVAEIPTTSANDVSVLNNTFYVDINSISGNDANISVIWASTYEWCPFVTNTIMATFTSSGSSIGTITRNLHGYSLFQLEEDSSGNLNTTILQQFVSIRTALFSKSKGSQRPALHYFDKDKNSCILSFTSMVAGSQQVYEGIMTTKQPNANGLYETYKVRFELNYTGTTYSNHSLTKTKIGIVFDETAISGYSSTGTKQLQLNNGVLEWV